MPILPATPADTRKRKRATGSLIVPDPVSDLVSTSGINKDRIPSELGGRCSEGATVWLTGLSGAGKSTIANLLAARLRDSGAKVEVLDGDELRTTLCKDLGFTREDREENIRRIAFVCAVLNRHGVFVIVAAISPYRTARDAARSQLRHFIEVFVTCPLDVLKQRDPKGLYKRALAGDIAHFTGISDPYEPPEYAELTIDSSQETVETSVERVLDHLRSIATPSSK